MGGPWSRLVVGSATIPQLSREKELFGMEPRQGFSEGRMTQAALFPVGSEVAAIEDQKSWFYFQGHLLKHFSAWPLDGRIVLFYVPEEEQKSASELFLFIQQILIACLINTGFNIVAVQYFTKHVNIPVGCMHGMTSPVLWAACFFVVKGCIETQGRLRSVSLHLSTRPSDRYLVGYLLPVGSEYVFYITWVRHTFYPVESSVPTNY